MNQKKKAKGGELAGGVRVEKASAGNFSDQIGNKDSSDLILLRKEGSVF